MKRSFALIAFVALAEVAAAQTVPMPRPRPFLHSDDAVSARAAVTPTPSACRLRLTAARAIAPSVNSIDGPEGCGSVDLVRLEAVMLSNNDRVEISPPAVLRCGMAEAVADWVRDDLAELAVLNFGSRLRSMRNYAAYHCRGRNNIVGGVTSEHGKGNALDVGFDHTRQWQDDRSDRPEGLAGLPGGLEKERVRPFLYSAWAWVRWIP